MKTIYILFAALTVSTSAMAQNVSFIFQSGEIAIDAANIQGAQGQHENIIYQTEYDFSVPWNANSAQAAVVPSGFEAPPSCKADIHFANGKRIVRVMGAQSGQVLFTQQSSFGLSANFVSGDTGNCILPQDSAIEVDTFLGEQNFSLGSIFTNLALNNGDTLQLMEFTNSQGESSEPSIHLSLSNTGGAYTLRNASVVPGSGTAGLFWSTFSGQAHLGGATSFVKR